MTMECLGGACRGAVLLAGLAGVGAGCASPESDAPQTDAAGSEDVESDTAGDAAGDTVGADSVRGNRYCEVLLAFLDGGAIEAQVWGTQGINDCPAADWASVDAAAIAAQFGASRAVLNGPRYWVIDGLAAELPEGEPRRFGTLQMQLLATVTLAPGTAASVPYVERTIRRNSEFEFRAGSEVYELLAPNGSVYVMQSYAQIVRPELVEADLPALGEQLDLPEGWEYRARTLDAPLVVSTPGEATVVQDELQNSYSRYAVGQ